MPRPRNNAELAEPGALEAIDNLDPFKVKRKRGKTLEEVRRDRDPGLRDRLDFQSVFGQTVGIHNAQQRIRIYDAYAELKAEQGFDDQPFDWEICAKLCRDYLLDRVEMSEYEEKDGSKAYMKTQSLARAIRDLDIIVKMDAPPRPQQEDIKWFWDYLSEYKAALVNEFRLSNEVADKVMLTEADIALAMSEVLTQPYDAETAVQKALELCLLLFTGSRPSTLTLGRHSSFFMPWNDATLIPRRVNGVTVGFDVRLSLRNHKASQVGSSKSIAKTVRLYIRTVSRDSNLIVDLGCLLLAHGLRLGIFKDVETTEDAWKTDKMILEYAPGMGERPILLASNARGFGLERWAPIHYLGMREHFKAAMRAINISVKPGQVLGMSSIRRGTATSFAQDFGFVHAQMLISHGAGTATIHDNYDQSRDQLDISAAVLNEDAVDIERRVVPIGYRVPRAQTARNRADALALDAHLGVLCEAVKVLQACIVEESDNWMELPMFQRMQNVHPNDAALHLGKARRALKIRTAHVLNESQKEADRRAAEDADQLSYEEVMLNLKQASDVRTRMPKELIERILGRVAEDVADAQRDEAAEQLMMDDSDMDVVQAEESQIRGVANVAIRGAEDGFAALAEKKRHWITALVLLDGKTDVTRSESECRQCIGDTDVPPDMKTKLYLPGALRKHLAHYHLPLDALSRWFKSLGSTSQVWVCPCCAHRPTDQKDVRNHILSHHGDRIGLEIPIHHFRTIWTYAATGKNAYAKRCAAKVNFKAYLLGTYVAERHRSRGRSEGIVMLKRRNMKVVSVDEKRELRRIGRQVISEFF